MTLLLTLRTNEEKLNLTCFTSCKTRRRYIRNRYFPYTLVSLIIAYAIVKSLNLSSSDSTCKSKFSRAEAQRVEIRYQSNDV